MKSLVRAWQERTRTLRGKSLTEYEAFWADWHSKYDRYRTRNGKHFLNSISMPGEYTYNHAVCICGAEYVNAPVGRTLLDAFQSHLDDNEPDRIDLSGTHSPV